MLASAAIRNVIIGLLFLASCVAQQPHDLYVDQIKTTRIQDTKTGSNDLPLGQHPKVLQIDVAAPSGLEHVADAYGSPIRFRARFCGPWKTWGPRSAILYPNSLTGEKGNIEGLRDSAGIHHYKINVYISDHPPPYESRLPYDLSTDPRDICVSAFGGNETGFSYRSNEAVASRAQIAAAIRLDP